LFANGIDAANCFGYAFPGETGQRNQLRGPGFFGVDLGLAKRWKMPWSDNHSLQFRWEVFNVTNSVRFRCAVGERLRGREFGEWEFGELREL
jgi:hypothetical protein